MIRGFGQSPDQDEKPQPIRRLWEPWHLWEDYKHNFYGGVTDDWPKDQTREIYADMLRDLPRFEAALKVIISEWHHSNRHNLTNAGLNRVAYLGQCAGALLFRAPHKETMGGYQHLSDVEKVAADAMAQKYLDLWLAEHADEITP